MKNVLLHVSYSLVSAFFSVGAVHAGPVKPYKIGVCFALTGEAAKWTAAQRQGIELAESDLKNSGVPLEIIWDDTSVSTEKSVRCVQRMVDVNRAEIVVGNIWAFLTMPMIPLAERLHVPLISPGFYREQCPHHSKYFFSVSEQIGSVTPAFSRLLARHPEWKRLGVFVIDDGTWGVANERAVAMAAQEYQREIVDIVRTQDLHPDLHSIYPAMFQKKPDVIFAFHEPFGSVKPLRDFQYKGAIVVSNAVGEQIWDQGKTSSIFEGVYFADILQFGTFRTKYLERTRKLPILEAHSGYDALAVAVQALQRNRLDPADALRTGEFDGVYQKLKFDDSCAAKHTDWKIFRIVNGIPQMDEK